MNSLLETQRAFASALRGSETLPRIAIRQAGSAGAQRFQVYRNNLLAACCNALADTYSAVQTLVGEDFFDYAARQYAQKHPSLSGDLNDYGARFPRFVSSLPQTAHLPYLEDVALLEWSMQEIARAAEPALFNVRGLAEVPTARYPELRFTLHPASRLLSSTYPLLAIWRLQQSGVDPEATINLNAGGVCLLVIRRQQDIELEPLSRGEYEMLNALAGGDPLAAAVESALVCEPDFDVTVSIRDHVARRTIVNFCF